MIEQMIARLPDGWREVIEIGLAPISWIPRMQSALIDFFMETSPWAAVAKFVFLLFPLCLVTVALWCTQLSLYTLPFRSGRGRYISLLLLAWWDAALAVWLYWVGLVRMVSVMAGWLLALGNLTVRLGASLIRHVAGAPLAMTSAMTRSYFQPGFPWVAFVMLVFWCVLEAAVFSYTLTPTMTEVLADMVGSGEAPRFMTPIMYLLLLMLVMASFACIQMFTEAMRSRQMKFIVQIVLIELFVMFFEVMFLYRELVDSITPWIAQETGVKMGLVTTLSLACFGWIGIRGMTWFLFGQYGTPPLMAFIARKPLEQAAMSATVASPAAGPWWRPAIEDLRNELGWLHGKSEELMEYVALPVLHLLGAALNFGTILTSARPAFSLPFKGLKDVTERREAIVTAANLQRKGASL